MCSGVLIFFVICTLIVLLNRLVSKRIESSVDAFNYLFVNVVQLIVSSVSRN